VAFPAPLLLGLALGLGSSARPEEIPEPAPRLAQELSALRRRSASVEPGTLRARELARDLGRIGHEYLEIGETGRAIELLEEAYGWDEEDGLVLANLTLAYVREENYPFARFYLELAEQRAAQAPPEAYATLGDVYYALNRLDDAVLAWEQFERLEGNDPGLLKRLARARQEMSLSRGQRLLEEQGFAIYSDEAIAPEIAVNVADRLAESHRHQSRFFGTSLEDAQVVVLYAGRAYFSLVSVPDWVGGVFDGKIRVSMDPALGMTPDLERVLVHELGHALVRKASADRAPGWLHEGLAQWVEGKRLLPHDFREVFSGGHKPSTLAEMEGSLGRRTERGAARALYAEALGLVEYVVQYRGEGAVLCLLQAVARGASIEEALKRETGWTGAELVAAWRNWAGV
jgi:tetratricopeptide (TPR) repeat protein